MNIFAPSPEEIKKAMDDIWEAGIVPGKNDGISFDSLRIAYKTMVCYLEECLKE